MQIGREYLPYVNTLRHNFWSCFIVQWVNAISTEYLLFDGSYSGLIIFNILIKSCFSTVQMGTIGHFLLDNSLSGAQMCISYRFHSALTNFEQHGGLFCTELLFLDDKWLELYAVICWK